MIEIIGFVSSEFTGGKSKSQKLSILLNVNNKQYHLRKRGDNAFENKELFPYIGKMVKIKGIIADYLLIAEEINILS